MNDPKNIFTNAQVIGFATNPELYHLHAVPRGDPSYVMSRSALMEFDRCPARWIAGYEPGDTDATDWGNLIDILVLDPVRFGLRVAVTPATYPVRDKIGATGEMKPWTRQANYCKEWEAERKGLLIVKPAEFADAQTAVGRLLADTEIAALLKASQTQVLVHAEYHDPETKLVVPLKFLIDAVPKADSEHGKCLADLKTCASAAPFAWGRAVLERGYHVQAAMYLDAYVAATGEDRVEFRHILQENYAPWQTAKRILTSEFVELGRMKYQLALRRYAMCLAMNRWPDYDTESARQYQGWQFTDAEPWMMNK